MSLSFSLLLRVILYFVTGLFDRSRLDFELNDCFRKWMFVFVCMVYALVISASRNK